MNTITNNRKDVANGMNIMNQRVKILEDSPIAFDAPPLKEEDVPQAHGIYTPSEQIAMLDPQAE